MRSARLLSLLAVVTVAVASLGATADDDQRVVVFNYTCSATGNYTDGSPYGKNLAELLSTLSTPATAVDNWWFRSRPVVAGAAAAADDQASGLAMFYADTDAARCQNCLETVARSSDEFFDFFPECSHSRNVSFLSSDGCVVRYADAPFFGSATDSSGARLTLRSRHEAADAAGMREARRRLLGQLAESAGGEALRFAAGSQGYMDAVLGAPQVMYGMVQCTRDLPASECTGCLVDLLAVMYRDVSVINSTEASVMGFSCYLSYQVNKPIAIAGMAPPPSPATTAEPPSGSTPSPPGGRTPLIAALAAVAGAVTLFIVGV